MKKMIMVLALLTAACAGNTRIETVEVKVPVWTPPKVTMPVRPVLNDMSVAKTEGDVVRAAVNNQIDIQLYAKNLEEIVEALLKE